MKMVLKTLSVGELRSPNSTARQHNIHQRKKARTLFSEHGIVVPIIVDERMQIMERHNAAWREWCQRRNYVFKKEQGWGDEVSTLKTSDRGASCVSMVPLVPEFNDFEANLYQGISCMAQFETIIDFQFLTRTLNQKFERISRGMKPNEIDDQYYDCTAVE